MELAFAIDLVPVGGAILMHDMWMPSMLATRQWVETNLKGCIKVVPQTVSKIMMVLVKVAPDHRHWSHFVPFDLTFIEENNFTDTRNIDFLYD